MGRLKFLIIAFSITVLIESCSRTGNPQTNIVPYQIFPVDSTSKLCLYLCDEWGDRCILCLNESGSIHSMSVTMEEIPYIKKIGNDTIILAADLFESQGLGVPSHRNAHSTNFRKLGDYTIVYEYHYDLRGEELSIELGYGAQDYARKVDQVIQKNDSVFFSFQGGNISSQPQQNIFYLAQGNRSGQFYYCTIDSARMKKQLHFLYPTKDVTKKYFSSYTDWEL